MDPADADTIKRHFNVVAERLESRIQLLAEGLARLDEKVDQFENRVNEQFEETRAMIRLSYSELDRRIRTLESGHANLEARVERLEAR
jgi:exonuclease VII small subunit